ncbi:hypothetical protein SAMN04488120_10546 [Fontimonas thermophila]|uniref:DUF1820 family protein n=1 Tax=Fontimonas thermophila TaxID=1076937 RepID=A0A1I2J030_9GAMM|nr:DUF1820 family protein [Fontimonas thermophila]SFF47348.1 hypothetical protein SAMN04488120_10546 [Fontimonas thermophila]
MSAKQRLYRVSFMNQGQVYEVYAREVSHGGGMLGFVEIGKLVFGENTTLVVDTSEEKLKQEFADVERFYVPVHAVVRIDEVSKRGSARIVGGADTGAKVTPFPIYNFGKDPKK